MEFRILGALAVRADGDELPIGGGKQRALLARLLIDANHPVSEDVLIEALWPERRPASAADNLHVLVSRLRRAVGADRIVREGHGYLVRVEQGELDLDRFEQLRQEGRPAEALALWHGDPLADFTYADWAQNELRRLEELRLLALEERIEADFEAGRHGELVGELRALVAQHPLRETLRRHLIVALYRSERQAEALEAYRDARRMLDEELGLQPSPALRELEGAVLRHDPSLERPRAVPVVTAVRQKRPAALAAAAVALAAGFASAIAAIQLLDGGKGERVAAAAAPRTTNERAKPQPRPASTTRVVVIRERTRPAPPPKAPKPAVRPSPPPPPPPAPIAPPPPPPQPPPPPPPKAQAKPKPKPVNPQPAPQPAPEPAPAPANFRLTDNFDDGAFDRATWSRSNSNGVTVEERNGRLEMAVSPAAVAEGDHALIFGVLGTHCRFAGDFDARVEFELLEWPEANGIALQLAAWFPAQNLGVVRWSNRQREQYGSWGTQVSPSSPTGDLRGALRIRRVGDRITTYFQRAGAWDALQTISGSFGAPLIGLQALSKDEWFADKPVRVAFDNFSVAAEERVCGG